MTTTPDTASSGNTASSEDLEAENELAEATRRAYASDWKRWVAWCAVNDQLPLPATAPALADYTAHLCGVGRAVSTIERAITTIVATHNAAEEPPPSRIIAKRVLRAYAKEKNEAGTLSVRKAAPVTVSVLRAMAATCSPFTTIGVRDRALLVLGFVVGARRSELAALDLADVVETPAGLNVTVRFSRSVGQEQRVVAVPFGADPRTCPVRVVRAWRELLAEAGRTEGPLFVRVDRHGHLGNVATGRGSADGRLSDRSIANVVRRTAERAGLDPEACWAGHSLRRGLATEAYRTGGDPLGIARHGGWQSGSAALHSNFEVGDEWRANPLLGLDL